MLAAREDGPSIGQKGLARGRKRDTPRQAHQQWHAQLFLKLPDLCGQWRLRNEQLLGRAADAARLGHGDEIAQVSQLHAGTICDVWEMDAIGI